MIYESTSKGSNQYVVNVITFSGHGFTFKNEAYAVITEEEKKEDGEIKRVFRFINIYYWAK